GREGRGVWRLAAVLARQPGGLRAGLAVLAAAFALAALAARVARYHQDRVVGGEDLEQLLSLVDDVGQGAGVGRLRLRGLVRRRLRIGFRRALRLDLAFGTGGLRRILRRLVHQCADRSAAVALPAPGERALDQVHAQEGRGLTGLRML